MLIRVNGTTGGGTTTSSDATLSALALADASDDSAITISPVFASGTTSYTASVDNGVDEITIDPTVNEGNATVEYLDSSDTEIADANSGKTGRQVSLDVGANTIKVKVTAQDDTTDTYTVVVTRNTAPTGADKTVTTAEDTAYTFAATDFGFVDADSDPLASVKIVTLPVAGNGTLELSGTAVVADEVVPEASIGNLAYIPPENANGTGYASFTFKVSDGTDESAVANTMTIDVTPGNDPATGEPTITGTAQVGRTLTADTTGILDEDGLTSPTYTYQWIRVDGTDDDIADENASTYTLVDADLGKTIKVRVSFDDDGGNTETLTSAATATVTAAIIPPGSAGLVSNLNQVATSNQLDFSPGSARYSFAQGFRTGANPGGYTLTSIEIAFSAAVSAAQIGAVTASVWTADGSGNPATDLFALTKPASFGTPTTTTSGSLDEFYTLSGNYAVLTAPGGTTLDPSTRYLMVVVGGPNTLWSTASDAETGAAGWSIADAARWKETTPNPGSWAAQSNSHAMSIRVNGTTGGGTTTSSDATLSALALADAADDSAITISPVFASGTTSYTADVDNDVDVITIDPTVNESNATFEYLDSTDTPIADADSGKTGQQVSLSEGANTIKVKVTAQDTTTSTYTVVVTRAAAPNNAPVFSSSPVALDLAENTAADQDIGDAVTATDADAGDTLAYTLGGTDMASFDIVGTTGQIRTISGVSYDHEAKDSYTVTVTASDGTDSAVADVTISITDVDEPPVAPATPTVVAAAGSNTSLTVSWDAPANAGRPAIDNYDVQYRESGAAAWTDGPQDVTGTTTTITSLTADTEYEVQVRATNDEGDSGWSAPPGEGRTNSSTNTAAVGAPTITGTAQVGETLTAATTGITDADGLASPGYTYQWIRVDGSEVDIAGANSSTYILDAADLGKTIKVRVTFTDDASNSETLTSVATETVIAAPNTAPTAADNTVTTAEDTAYTFTAGDFGFVDADGDALASVKIVTPPASDKGTLELSGTAVAADEVVPAASIGNLAYTPPADANGTGYASFTFKVSDGTVDSAVANTMTIDVTPGNDPATGEPTITGTAQVGETLTAVTTGILDVDGLTSATYTYQWIRANGTDAAIAGANSSTYTLDAADLGKTIKVKVSFTDDGGTPETLTSVATATVIAANNAPVFSSSTVALDLAENTAADQDVGAAVTATDADAGDTLAYTLGGTDMASFDIVGTTGQIRTISGVSYDHEAKSSYTVTVTASDGTDSAVADVTITITDVDEPPVAPATPTVVAAAGSNTSLTVSWIAPANAGRPDIDNYDVQYRASGVAAWTDGPQNVTTTTTTNASSRSTFSAAVTVTGSRHQRRSSRISAESIPPGEGRTNWRTNNAAEGAPSITGDGAGVRDADTVLSTDEDTDGIRVG